MPTEKSPPGLASEAGCHLCWLVDRIENGRGPLEIGLCYALHSGAAAAGGAHLPICERHQELVDRTGRDFMQAMASGSPPAPSPERPS